MKDLRSIFDAQRCRAVISVALASLAFYGCAPALLFAVPENAAAEARAAKHPKVSQRFPVQENENIRREVNAAVTVPPGRGIPDYCSRAHQVRTKRSACLDTGGLTEPVRYAMLHGEGRYAVKLLVYMKTESPTTFHLVRVDTQTKLEKFMTQWDARNRSDEIYEKAISISPDGKRVALVRYASDARGAGRFMKQGTLDLYDIERNTWQSLEIDALDGHPVQWLDDNRIVFARAVKRDDVPAPWFDAKNSSDDFGAVYSRAAIVPVVFLRDLRSRTERALHIGRVAIASPSGRELIVQDDALKMRRIAIDDEAMRSMPIAALPAMTHRGLVGFAGSTHVTYWAEPFTGRETQYTRSNSPLVGPKKLLSLRIANIENGEFVTVVERIDPRSRPSVTTMK